jgi:hypothetical protein
MKLKKHILKISYILVFICILAIGLLSPVYASVLLDDGFESGDFSGWNAGQTGSPTVQTAIKNSGTYAMKGTSHQCFTAESFTGQTTIDVRIYFYMATAPSGTDKYCVINLETSGYSLRGVVQINATGIAIISSSANVLYSYNFSATTWYCIELDTIMGSSGSYKVYLDGTQVISTSATPSNTVAQVVIGDYLGTNDHTFYVDDVKITSDGYIGPSPTPTPTATPTPTPTPVWNKSFDGVPSGSIGSIDGLPIGNIKSVDGVP